MRVHSKNHALALRDDSARFFNEFGRAAQGSAEALIRNDYYKAALRHLLNTINGFDYLFEAQVGVLEQKVDTLEAQNRRLAQEVAQLRQALRAAKGEAARRTRQPDKTSKAPADLRQGRRRNGAAPARQASAQRAAASQTATRYETLRPGARPAADLLPGPSAILLRYLLQGQRNFLDQHSDAGVTGALAFLIQHTLTQLQAASQTPHALVGQQAMYHNLYTISNQLRRYKGRALNGFQSAVEELETIFPGIDEFAGAVPAKRKKRAEAKLFQETLKLLRDHARVDFRPYFYEIDPQDGKVFAIG